MKMDVYWGFSQVPMDGDTYAIHVNDKVHLVIGVLAERPFCEECPLRDRSPNLLPFPISEGSLDHSCVCWISCKPIGNGKWYTIKGVEEDIE